VVARHDLAQTVARLASNHLCSVAANHQLGILAPQVLSFARSGDERASESESRSDATNVVEHANDGEAEYLEGFEDRRIVWLSEPPTTISLNLAGVTRSFHHLYRLLQTG
jgi:hypothetical protein